MCISGQDTTVLNVPRKRAILAYRHWGIGTDWSKDGTPYVLCPSFTSSYWAGNRRVQIKNPWLKPVAVANRKPPKSWTSDFGIHALAQACDPGCCVAGTVRLWGKVVVHRNSRGGIEGYRAQYARVTTISRSRSNQGRLEDLKGIAKRLGARMVK